MHLIQIKLKARQVLSCPLLCCRPTIARKAAALRDFSPAYVGSGSESVFWRCPQHDRFDLVSGRKCVLMRLLGVCLVRLHGWIDAVETASMRHSPCSSLPADRAQHGRAIDAARYCGLDQRIAHRLVPTVAVARSEQHGGALVDERLTSASLYGRFKGDLSNPAGYAVEGVPLAH